MKLKHWLSLYPCCRSIGFILLHFIWFYCSTALWQLLLNEYNVCVVGLISPSVLWRCWLGGRKGIRPVKKLEWWGAGAVICLERGADLRMAQLMSLPLTVSCSSKIQVGFTFLVPADPDSSGQRAVKRVCVCVLGWGLQKRKWPPPSGPIWLRRVYILDTSVLL